MRHGEGRVTSDELALFESTVLPHLDAAFTLARYLVRNEQDAEDIVQDAVLRALKYFEGFRGDAEASARSWLLAIVRNTAHSWRHRHRGDADVMEFDETQHSESVAHEHPEGRMARSTERETLARALSVLAPEFREVIVLRELQGLSYKEISQVANVPVGTVMSRLSRARSHLKAALLAEEQR